jgi:hypothetical protein
MLDIRDATALSELDWEQLASRAELPCSWQDYAAGAGAVHTKADSTRQYCRVALRSIAIVWADGVAHAVYTKDVSKMGLGFYSPVHLLPRSSVRIWLPGRSPLGLKVTRCRRLDERCFECGALFDVVKGPGAHRAP